MTRDYYIFEVEDTWAVEQFGDSTGEYSISEVTEKGISRVLGINNLDRPATFEEVLEFCKRKGITKLFTTNPESLCLEDSLDEDDGHVIEYSRLSRIDDFKGQGVDVEDRD